ncbi:MAG: EamA family transporter RarD [Acidimicrobiales bacterium]|jgi:chloramphenicol-sensitive protein RarD
MRRGVLVALAAYTWWGISPVFWKMHDVPALDAIGFRVAATMILLGLIQAKRGVLGDIRRMLGDRRTRLVFAVSGTMLALNWLGFVYAVNSDQLLQSSLGYFINPLLSVLIGVLVLGERLHRMQAVAIGIVAIGVAVLSFDLGEVPWLALLIATTFAVYGYLRKTAPVESLDGLTLEMVMLVPIAVAYLVIRAAMGDGLVGVSVPGRDVWLATTAIVTGIPLICFGWAARRIPLSLVGVLFYVNPTLQFLLGVVVYDEPWSGGQTVGYVVIWAGLAVFALGSRRTFDQDVIHRVPADHT